MPANRSTRVVLCAWCLFWALMVLIAMQEYRRSGGQHLWQPLVWELSSALVLSVLWLVQQRATARHAVLVERPWRWFALQAAWLPMYWVAFVPLAFGIRHSVYALAGATYHHDPLPQLLLFEASKISLFVCLFIVIRFGLLSWRRMVEESLRSERATALLRQAELQRLAQQVQPHFLFNALNTVSSLMHTDVDKADATLVQLASLLRATLQAGQSGQASLAAELALARSYADVMAARFGTRVSLDWQADADLLPLQLPAVSVQPLLENVFKHTVERRQEHTGIAVSAWREGQELVLRVEDDAGVLAVPAALSADASLSAVPEARLDGTGQPGAALPAAGTGFATSGPAPHGVGLSNLRARLASLHGPRGTLTLSQLLPAGVRAEMRVPCAP